MNTFSLNTRATTLLKDRGLQEALAKVCVTPDLAAPDDIVALGMTMRSGCRQAEIFQGDCKLGILQSNKRNRILKWYTPAIAALVKPKFSDLADAFAALTHADSHDLGKAVRHMHALTGQEISTYTVLVGRKGGYVRRRNVTLAEDHMSPEVHRNDVAIQRYIDSQCLVLVPAQASAHEQLQAVKFGAQIGLDSYHLYHPSTNAAITPIPLSPMDRIAA